MKNKIKIFRILVRCASIALLSFSMAGCGADFLDTTPTNNISGSSIWTKATLAEQAVIGVYNVFLDQYCPNSGILDSHRIPWDAYSSVMDTDKNWIKRMPNCTGAATPSSGLFSDIYKRFYTFIYRANDVIDNIGQVPDMSTGEKQRAIAECKFLRAFAYMRLNILYKGVPLYMNAITSPENGNKARSSEADVWAAVLQDLTDCVNEPNLPGKYNSGDSNYGRVTKGAAYALRGQVYMWQKNWEAAVDDFNSVADCGFGLYTKAGATSYKQLLKIANEQCEEMIFSVQCIKQYGYSNTRNITYGNRCTAGSMWNNYLPNPHFVESFETATGEKFNWDNYLPGYSTMREKERVVFLPDRLIAHLRRYVKKRKITSGEIFISRTGKRLDRTAIWRMMKRLCAKAGVDQKKVFPHNLRHLFATTYYRMKKDISKLADLLGHSSIETTRIYLITSGVEHQRQLERLGLVL